MESDNRRPNTVTKTRTVKIGTGVTGTRLLGPEHGRTFSATDHDTSEDADTAAADGRRMRRKMEDNNANEVVVPGLDDDDEASHTSDFSASFSSGGDEMADA
jgi:hypothetical protein